MPSPRTLIIPDIHQDHTFLARILEREQVEDFEQVVLLGDYFDSRTVDFRGPKAAARTARMIFDLEAKLGSRLTLLWGNHDLPYYAQLMLGGETVVTQKALAALGVRPESKANFDAVHRQLPTAFWKKLRPFILVGDYLLSHAGLHRSFLPVRAGDLPKGLVALQNSWDLALAELLTENRVAPILHPGEARGGEEGAISGPTWLDWEREFADDLPVAQIVGHTANVSTRQRGRSWCIDYEQCAYAILGKELEIKPAQV